MKRILLVTFEVDAESNITNEELEALGDDIASQYADDIPLTFDGSHVIVRRNTTIVVYV